MKIPSPLVKSKHRQGTRACSWRPAVTLPIEMYSDDRVREFDAAEAELAKVLPKNLVNESLVNKSRAKKRRR